MARNAGELTGFLTPPLEVYGPLEGAPSGSGDGTSHGGLTTAATLADCGERVGRWGS